MNEGYLSTVLEECLQFFLSAVVNWTLEFLEAISPLIQAASVSNWRGVKGF